eukprot:TRINITY_DN8096_c0_g3_i1.p1 TRINITY_DN8096_c0_g3~~TRINITY_DN8096_c0_g3_i1.p1  ORF type:complete len:760 (+),score=126.47 TRINITY_DN8096_c0_g3_i1:385-2664(+)
MSPQLALLARQLQNFKQLKQFHAHIIQLSLHHNVYFLSTLLTQCVRLHSPLSYARQLFDSAPHPNLPIFTSMLKLYSHVGSHDDVIGLFCRMQAFNLRPDAFVFPILIKSAGKGGTGIQTQVLKLGFESDRYVRNAIMDMYAKHGAMDVARKVFDGIPDKAVADWNVMVSGYWRCGDEVEARCMFDSMPERNVVSWTAMVSGYSKCGDLENARRIFEEMPEKSVASWNALLSGYAQKGLVEDGLRVFEEMMDSGFRPDETTWVTVISMCSVRGDLKLAESLVGTLHQRRIELNCFVKTALIDMYAKCGSLETAQQIFNSMAFRNPVTWNAMISGYARSGNLTLARQLFDKMPERNVISWNSMIAGYAQNGHFATAIKLFKEMVRTKELKPDEVTTVSVISACGHLGALELGKWVVKLIVENQIQLSISGYNSLIFMYSRCGSMEEAKKVFREMPSRDLVSYNSLIAGFAIHGHGHEALELLSRMKEEGVEPDRITFIGILTACSHAGLSKQGRQIFESIEYPAIDHYSCMVDLLGRAGELDEAKRLVNNMPMKPHAGVYGALLNAARIHKHVELGELAASELFELEPENPGNYVLLSNIYASLGRWGDVERVWKLMQARGVKKTTACSWVEFNHQIHQFIAGDRSHERTKEIYEVLEKLGKRMRELGYIADKRCVLRDVEEEEKEEMVGTHSEKLAIGFGLLVSKAGEVIRVVKNLRVCGDCHIAIKMISKLTGREIVVRDNNRFHRFKDGECSCKDYW